MPGVPGVPALHPGLCISLVHVPPGRGHRVERGHTDPRASDGSATRSRRTRAAGPRGGGVGGARAARCLSTYGGEATEILQRCYRMARRPGAQGRLWGRERRTVARFDVRRAARDHAGGRRAGCWRTGASPMTSRSSALRARHRASGAALRRRGRTCGGSTRVDVLPGAEAPGINGPAGESARRADTPGPPRLWDRLNSNHERVAHPQA